MNVSSIDIGTPESTLATLAGRQLQLLMSATAANAQANTATATTVPTSTVPTTNVPQAPLVVAEIVQALTQNQSQSAGIVQALSQNQSQSTGIDKGNATNAYLVRVGGTIIEALSAESFSVGSKVLARLEPTAQGTVLTVDPPEQVSTGEIASAILRDTPARQPLGDVLQELNQAVPRLLTSAAGDPVATKSLEVLQSTLERLLEPTQSPPEPEHIAQFVQDGGIHYEAKLGRLSGSPVTPEQVKQVAAGDLKGQLLNVLATARNLPAGNSETHPLELVRQAVSEIESQQAVNLIAKSGGEPYQLQVPLATQGTASTLQLSINPDASGQSSSHAESNDFNLLMHLEFTDLGNTWVDARFSPQGMNAILYVESEAGREAARADLSMLNKSLQELGFANVLLDVRSTSDMPTGKAAAKFNALDASMPASVSLIDRKA
jgi:hypothetical protein